MMEKDANTLSVGEKLLKEPIWIGMIVILNLILFFCITYVIRRKCGQRISELIPSRKKSDITVPKDPRTDPPSFERSTYSASTETIPRLSIVPRPKPRMSIEIHQQDKPEPSISSSISLPQTPVITEHNSDAALKLFAAYKADKEAQPTLTELTVDNDKTIPSQTRRDFISCGFQGGRVSFSDEDDHLKDKSDDIGKANELVRSKSSEIDSYRSDDKKIKRVFTYPKPCSSSPKLDMKRDIHRNSVHCYPEIRIVNEFDQEFKNIDSDYSEVDTQIVKQSVSLSKSLCNEDLNLTTNLETMDSGYPSTSTVSSNNTQHTNQETFVTKHSNPTAAERRRMFGAKTKSSTFYRLSAQTLEADNDEIELPTVSVNELSFDKKPRLISNRPEFRSFETGMACRSCNDLTNFSMNSFSIESDIEQMRRCESFCQCCSRHEYQPQRHSCGRRKHQRRHKCCCHRHSYPEREHSRYVHTRSHNVHHTHQSRYYTRYTSPTSRYLSLSEIRDIRRNHKRALARLSSTESEGLYQENESYHKRRVYSSKEHYSDGCISRKRLSTSPNFMSCRDDYFKNQMMQSFLSDTFNSNAHLNQQNLDVYTEAVGSNNRLALPQYSINEQITNTALNNSQCSSHSISPTRGQSYKSQSPKSMKSNSSPVEYSTVDTNPTNGTIAEVFKAKIQACDSNSGLMKDSAYQTNQSSVEVHNTIQREGSLLSSNSIKDDDLGRDKSTDPVRRHLQRAALKLVFLKRRQNLQDSKDSAIQTFSGDEMSLDDDNKRSFEKRKGALLSLQMKEIKLSQVQEEHSVLSKDTDSYNTPNNEMMSETTEKNVASFDNTISSANIFIDDDVYSVQETVV